MAAGIILLIVLCLATFVVDSCPIVSNVNASCCEIRSRNKFKFTTVTAAKVNSRVYNITNFCGDCEEVAEGYCDGVTGGGGWLVVQRRQDGSVDFNRGWADYEDGFGSLTGEFWYGLRPLHCLTNQGQWELHIDFSLTDGIRSYLSYSSFKIGPASSNYTLLSISGFKGTTSSDPFSDYPLNGMPFTTKDRDNDKWSSNCAVKDAGGNAGGWWYNACSHIFLNHQYKSTYGIYLSGWKALSFIEMKIRPINCII